MDIATLDNIGLFLWLAVIACLLLLFHKVLRVKPNLREPPFIPSKFPYFGHLIGLFWYKMQYYAILSEKFNHSIYSLAMPGGQLYVVNSPELVLSVQRHPKTLSFWFIEAKFSAILGGLSSKTEDILRSNVHGELGKTGLFLDGMKAAHKAIMPGDRMDQMSRVAVKMIAESLDKLERDEAFQHIDLWKWVEHEMLLATTGAFYGPGDPYQDPEVENGFWDYSNNTIMLLVNTLPRLLAPRGFNGREKVVRAFQNYLATPAHLTASPMIHEQIAILTRYGIPPSEIARFETVRGFAILRNALPTAFWALYHVFADPALLAALREASTRLLTTAKTNAGVTRYTIDLTNMRDTAPLLPSLIHETLRLHAHGASTRVVLADTLLASHNSPPYLLKAGAYIMLLNTSLHHSPTTWGPSPLSFSAARFVGTKIPPGAFQGFGGGQNACPGRYFALVEIAALVAMMALRFEVRPEGGVWGGRGGVVQDARNVSLVIAPPRGEIGVQVKVREGWERSEWAFKL